MHTVLVGIFALSVLFGTIKCFQQSPKLIGTHIVSSSFDNCFTLNKTL